MNKLYILEMNSGEIPKEISIDSFLSQEVKDKIKEESKEMGVELEIKQITEAEPFVRNYFEKKGYNVIRCQYQRGYGEGYNRDLFDLEKKGLLPKKISDHAIIAGVPDWFCFKNKEDWFFVEVKSQIDGLRINQAKWIIDTKYKTKVVYTEDSNKNQ